VATERLEVDVFAGQRPVETRVRKPVRVTPDGFAGISYGGSVYPLVAGNSINLEGVSWEIEDCNRFLISGSPIPYAPEQKNRMGENEFLNLTIEWNLDEAPTGFYLAFNADFVSARQVIRTLEINGLGIQRWDVSHRQADNGKFYDWFARIETPAPYSDVVTVVESLFNEPLLDLSEVSADLDTVKFDEYERQISALRSDLSRLKAELERSTDERSELKRKLSESDKTQKRLDSELEKSKKDNLRIDEMLHRIRDDVIQRESQRIKESVNLDAAEGLMQDLITENSDLKVKIEEVESAAYRGAVENLELQEVNDRLQNQIDELLEVDRERRISSVVQRDSKQGVEGYLSSGFPRINFIDDSVEQLANLSKPSAALRVIMQIDTGQVIGKDVAGLRGWREISKIATGISGREMSARVYYRPSGEQVDVSVNLKLDDKQQRRHIERLNKI